MKKLFVLTAFFAFIASPVWAQESREAKVDDKKQVQSEWQQKIKEELKLSEEQVTQWDALNKEYKTKMDAIMQNASMDKETQKLKKAELKKEKEFKFQQLLNADQQARYKEMLEQKKKDAAEKQAGS